MNFKELQLRIKASGKKLSQFLKITGIPIHQYYYHKRKSEQSEDNHHLEFIEIKQSNKIQAVDSPEFQISQIIVEYKNGVKLHIQNTLTRDDSIYESTSIFFVSRHS